MKTKIQKNYRKCKNVTFLNFGRKTTAFPSKSYIENAHFNFWSKIPRDVTERAMMNSRKSIEPEKKKNN